MKYQAHLDGLRAVSIVLVMCNHIQGTPSFIVGGVGVDLFFALSGWLITSIIMNEYNKTGDVDLYSFYIRRIFRIFPLYFLTICLYAVSALVSVYFLRNTSKWVEFTHSIAYLLTFNVDLIPDSERPIFGHAWTLGVEEKFYIVWPMTFVIFSARAKLSKTAIMFGTIIGILLVSQNVQAARSIIDLGLSCCLAILVGRDVDVWRRRLSGREGMFALALVAGYFCSLRGPQEITNIIVGILSSLLICSLNFNQNGVLSRVLSVSPLAFLGRLTYGVYLSHVLVLNVVEIVLNRMGIQTWAAILMSTYVLSITIAYVLRILIELPMIRLGRRLAARC